MVLADGSEINRLSGVVDILDNDPALALMEIVK